VTEFVDVWRFQLARSTKDLAELQGLLSEPELARVKRTLVDERRDAFIVRRGTLRKILADYMDIPPKDLAIVRGRNGKPELLQRRDGRSLRFNVSDSGHIALIAFAWDREVGIDFERIRTIKKADAIAQRWFSAESRLEIEKHEGELRNRVFLQHWARHEALLKARAATLWRPFLGITPTAENRSRRYVLNTDNFTTQDLHLGDGFLGAIAAAGGGWEVRLREFME
jgi:4'-phosphopantetheinyl transferase